MGGDVAALATEMTPYISAAASGYGGTVLPKMDDNALAWGRRVLGEEHPDAIQAAAKLLISKNDDEPEDDQDEDDSDEDDSDEDDSDEDDSDEDDWDEDLKPEGMPHEV